MNQPTEQYVETRELLPPVGPYHYAATLCFWKRNADGSTHKASLGEYFGKTREEAEAKAEKALDDPFWASSAGR